MESLPDNRDPFMSPLSNFERLVILLAFWGPIIFLIIAIYTVTVHPITAQTKSLLEEYKQVQHQEGL
jgi:hypothetical protein